MTTWDDERHECTIICTYGAGGDHDDIGNVPRGDPIQGPIDAPATVYSRRCRIGRTRSTHVCERDTGKQFTVLQTRQVSIAQHGTCRRSRAIDRTRDDMHRAGVLHPAEPRRRIASGQHFGQFPCGGHGSQRDAQQPCRSKLLNRRTWHTRAIGLSGTRGDVGEDPQCGSREGLTRGTRRVMQGEGHNETLSVA